MPDIGMGRRLLLIIMVVGIEMGLREGEIREEGELERDVRGMG